MTLTRVTVLMAVLIACEISLRALAAEPPAPKPSPGTAELASTVERAIRTFDALDRALPRDTFDVEALTHSIGTDPQALFAWVRDQTAFVPYAGALRGPSGVLMDRAGNSLDRSLLLARMLKVAGLRARLAHRKLTDAQARALLAAAWEKGQTIGAPSKPATEDWTASLAKQLGTDAAELQRGMEAEQLLSQRRLENLISGTAEQTFRLTAMLRRPDEPGISAKSSDSGARQLQAIADHWSAQYESAGTWTDCDLNPPSDKGNVKAGEGVEIVELSDDPLPLDIKRFALLYHEIEVRVIVEAQRAEGYERQVALKHVLRTAELADQSVTLLIAPADWPENIDMTGFDATKAAIAKQTRWTPILQVGDQQTRIAQSGFDDHGNLLSNPLASAMAQVGGAINKKITDALADPSLKPDEKKDGELTAVWVEFEMRVPGEPPLIRRRDLFDQFGPAARPGNLPKEVRPFADDRRFARALALQQRVDLLPLGASPTEEFVLHETLGAGLSSLPAMLAVLRDPKNKSADDILAKMTLPRRSPTPLLSWAAGRLPAANGAMVLDRPNLVALHRRLVMSADGKPRVRQTIDIIFNDLTPRPSAQNSAFAARLQQGVLETQLESAVLAPRGRRMNTAALFAAGDGAAGGSVQPWLTVRSTKDAQFAGLHLKPDALARISADLDAGFVVVAPADPVPVKGGTAQGWWRIDPRTGNCVGMMSDGTGAEMAEEAAILHHVLLGLEVLNTANCIGDNIGNSVKELGCVTCGAISIVLDVMLPGHSGVAILAKAAGAKGVGAACEQLYEGDEGHGGGGGE